MASFKENFNKVPCIWCAAGMSLFQLFVAGIKRLFGIGRPADAARLQPVTVDVPERETPQE